MDNKQLTLNNRTLEQEKNLERERYRTLFLKEKNGENKVFDGRRYFWVIDENDNLTNERGWD